MSPGDPRPAPRGRLALRVAAGFGVVLLLFVVALFVTRSAFEDISEAEAEVARLDRAKHAGHAVASLVREQYIRQAHTLITLDPTRTEAYAAATAAVILRVTKVVGRRGDSWL